MKVGIVGCGYVGSTAAYAITLKGVASELLLVDINERMEISAGILKNTADNLRV